MKILVAADDCDVVASLRSQLTQLEYEVVMAADGAAALGLLQAEDCAQITLLDRALPGIDALDVIRRVRRLEPEPHRYIIMLMAGGDQEDVVASLHAGADDYIYKSGEPHELAVRVRVGQRIVELHAQLVRAREALRYQATHDSLTGLWNHVSILDFLERELARGARLEDPVALIMADIDRFKEINEKYGHQIGDAVLEQVSQHLRGCVRSYDAIGRYGGEEFLLVLSDCNEKSAYEFAQRVRQNIEAASFIVNGVAVSVTVSLGVAVWPARGEVRPGELVRTADEALYSAKLAGRNRVEVTTIVHEGSGFHKRDVILPEGE